MFQDPTYGDKDKLLVCSSSSVDGRCSHLPLLYPTDLVHRQIIMALIATRCPNADFAQSAVQELDTVYEALRHLDIQRKGALQDLVNGFRFPIRIFELILAVGRDSKIS